MVLQLYKTMFSFLRNESQKVLGVKCYDVDDWLLNAFLYTNIAIL